MKFIEKLFAMTQMQQYLGYFIYRMEIRPGSFRAIAMSEGQTYKYIMQLLRNKNYHCYY